MGNDQSHEPDDSGYGDGRTHGQGDQEDHKPLQTLDVAPKVSGFRFTQQQRVERPRET